MYSPIYINTDAYIFSGKFSNFEIVIIALFCFVLLYFLEKIQLNNNG